jgi:hypothetical protein
MKMRNSGRSTARSLAAAGVFLDTLSFFEKDLGDKGIALLQEVGAALMSPSEQPELTFMRAVPNQREICEVARSGDWTCNQSWSSHPSTSRCELRSVQYCVASSSSSRGVLRYGCCARPCVQELGTTATGAAVAAPPRTITVSICCWCCARLTTQWSAQLLLTVVCAAQRDRRKAVG